MAALWTLDHCVQGFDGNGEGRLSLEGGDGSEQVAEFVGVEILVAQKIKRER
jgi:hypothetical protein